MMHQMRLPCLSTGTVRGFVRIWVFTILLSGLGVAGRLFAADPVDVGSTRQLFLDDYVIEKTENLQRRMHRPVRVADHSIVDTDQPWEQRVKFGVHLFG